MKNPALQFLDCIKNLFWCSFSITSPLISSRNKSCELLFNFVVVLFFGLLLFQQTISYISRIFGVGVVGVSFLFTFSFFHFFSFGSRRCVVMISIQSAIHLLPSFSFRNLSTVIASVQNIRLPLVIAILFYFIIFNRLIYLSIFHMPVMIEGCFWRRNFLLGKNIIKTNFMLQIKDFSRLGIFPPAPILNCTHSHEFKIGIINPYFPNFLVCTDSVKKETKKNAHAFIRKLFTI